MTPRPQTAIYGLFFALGAAAPHTAHAAGAELTVKGALFSVRQFDATGDGKTLDTQAIQKAIDAAGQAGGGTVYFPPGAYLSGTLLLRNRVTMYLEHGATLLGSVNLSDFPEIVPKFRSYTDNYTRTSLLYGEDVSNVAILGGGTIDGQGGQYKDRSYLKRPYIIRIVTSRNIRVEGLTLRNSPMWMQHYLACENVQIRGITVHNRSNANNDFVDIDCCRDARISDCFSESDDDAVTLKSTADRVCENVTVTNCVLSTACNGIKFGTESNGGFKNITVSNCTLYRVGLAGIALEIVDGGVLDGVAISNIAMSDVQSPIFLRLGNRARPFKKDMARPGMGQFRNVVVSNVVATGAGKTGCSIAGLPDHPVRNVTLSNISITSAGGGTQADATREVPERPEKYPECTMFGTLPSYGFYCRHVEGLTLSQIDLRTAREDLRPAIVLDDVQNVEIEGLRTRNSARVSPTLVFNDVRGALIRGCRPSPAVAFARLSGKTQGISVIGNDLSQADAPFQTVPSLGASALFEAANRIKPQR